MTLKKKIVKYLFGFTVLLLIINISVDYFLKSSNGEKQNISELTGRQIDSIFIDVLDQYGIEFGWISTKKINVVDEDSISQQYIVKLPSDLPIPLIIRDVHQIIENDITGFVSEEKKMFGTTEIRIYTNELLKLQATLIPDKETIRERNNLSFVISDAIYLGSNDYNELLAVPYKISLMITPSESGAERADSISAYSKEFTLLLNDENQEKMFKLEKGDHKTLLLNSINNLKKNFVNANTFVIDENSQLYRSAIYNFVRDEFKKRGIKLVPLSEFIFLEANNDSELISKFKFHCMDESSRNQKIFYTSFDNFIRIRNELELFRKKGFKIIPLSQLNLSAEK